jgi:flagellar biosynthesis anti-sigma factor FlgM
MQINDGNLLGLTPASPQQAERTGQAAAGRNAAGSVPPGAEDAVQLSSFAKKINELHDDSPARQARVEALRAQYLSGKYEIDPVALAQSVIDAHVRS